MFAFTTTSTLLRLANIAKDGNCATMGPVPRAGLLLRTASYAEGCNFTKEVELVGDSNLAGSATLWMTATLPSTAMLPRKYVIPPT
jgi:hypothetical protein